MVAARVHNEGSSSCPVEALALCLALDWIQYTHSSSLLAAFLCFAQQSVSQYREWLQSSEKNIALQLITVWLIHKYFVCYYFSMIWFYLWLLVSVWVFLVSDYRRNHNSFTLLFCLLLYQFLHLNAMNYKIDFWPNALFDLHERLKR